MDIDMHCVYCGNKKRWPIDFPLPWYAQCFGCYVGEEKIKIRVKARRLWARIRSAFA